MTAAIEPTPLTADGVAPLLSNSAMAMAGIASLGAGAIHAAAAGSHSEHRQAVLAFVIVAAFQLGWGALALVRFTSLIAARRGRRQRCRARRMAHGEVERHLVRRRARGG